MDDFTLPDFADALARHQDALAARGLAANTRDAYAGDLRGFAAFLRDRARVDRLAGVDRRHLEAYLAELDRRGLTGASRRRKAAALRSFFAFLETSGELGLDPAAALVPPPRAEGPPRALAEDELGRLVEAVRGEPRDAAIVAVLLGTGATVSELATLALRDVTLPAEPDLDSGGAGRLRVGAGTVRARTLPLDGETCRTVAAYLAARPPVESGALFLTRLGGPFSRRSLHRLVEKHLATAGVDGATARTLRHTFAARLAARGTELTVLQAALGHASPLSTARYVDLASRPTDRKQRLNVS